MVRYLFYTIGDLTSQSPLVDNLLNVFVLCVPVKRVMPRYEVLSGRLCAVYNEDGCHANQTRLPAREEGRSQMITNHSTTLTRGGEYIPSLFSLIFFFSYYCK